MTVTVKFTPETEKQYIELLHNASKIIGRGDAYIKHMLEDAVREQLGDKTGVAVLWLETYSSPLIDNKDPFDLVNRESVYLTSNNRSAKISISIDKHDLIVGSDDDVMFDVKL